MATESQVQAVIELIKAFGRRDAEVMLAHVAEDVHVRASTFIGGEEERRGRESLREGFTQMEENLAASHERLRLTPRSIYTDESDDDKVLAICRVDIVRENGETFGTEVSYLYVMDGDVVAELASFSGRDEGLRQLEHPVEAHVL